MDWKETAQRLAAHPRFRWLPCMKRAWTSEEEQRAWRSMVGYPWTMEKYMKENSFPVLTDWPTVGVLLGMVVEAARQQRPFKWRVELCNWGQPDYHGNERAWIAKSDNAESTHNEIPGQALAELLLELWGEYSG